MAIQKIVPEGLYETKQQCPYCHLSINIQGLWMETGHDDQHKKYCILVCHNCGYIRQSKLEGGKDE